MSEGGFFLETDLQQIPFAFLSNRGRVRQNNEDRLVVRRFITNESPPRFMLLAVLSDGVGGHRAGEIAAQIGVSAVTDFFGKLSTLDDPGKALRDAVVSANLAVLEASMANLNLEGMGATCICALILDKTLYLANLGDSRAYLLRGRAIHQLSFDHNWLENIDSIDLPGVKSITRNHPLAHVLSRYLGSVHPALVDIRIRPEKKLFQNKALTSTVLELHKGERILLCSDGLTDMLSDEEIKNAVQAKTLQKDVQQLVRCALEKGGHDNVSVILAEIPK